MREERTGQRVALVASVLAIGLVVAIAWFYRDEIWSRYLFIRTFESRGKNAQGYAEYRHRVTGILFVRIPGGEFTMGSSAEQIEAHLRRLLSRYPTLHEDEAGLRVQLSDEQPQHRVTLRSFLIAKHEVTQSQWNRVMEENPSNFKGDSLPVAQVSWGRCKEFCEKTGLSLPTEAQWEYACRAGTEGDFAGDVTAMAQYALDGGPRVVGEKDPNAFGLHDMHGNVAEWCSDAYHVDFYKWPEASLPDPELYSEISINRVHRGGCWNYSAHLCRSAKRYHATKISERTPDEIGFRPVARLP